MTHTLPMTEHDSDPLDTLAAAMHKLDVPDWLPWHPAGFEFAVDEGHLIVTDDDGYLIGVYTREQYTDAETAAAYLVIRDADKAAAVIAHLTTAMPEGVDWPAWAAQRIDDLSVDDDQFTRI